MRVLAVDPGRMKSGLAVGETGKILKRAVVGTSVVVETVRTWVADFAPERIILGNRTGGRDLFQELSGRFPGVPVVAAPEAGTTLEARVRYFQDHPPQGWRRLLPRSMQHPPEPYDDYAAIVLMERYWAEFGAARGGKNLEKTSKSREDSGET